MSNKKYALIIKVPEKDKSRRGKSRRKSKTGRTFEVLSNYVTDVYGKEQKPAWVRTRNLEGVKIAEAHEQMMRTASKNPYVKVPALHLIASLRPGLRPTEEKCMEIVGRILELYGLGEHEALIGADDNRNHFHLHIIANVVSRQTFKAAKVREGFMIKRALRIARKVEREFPQELPVEREQKLSVTAEVNPSPASPAITGRQDAPSTQTEDSSKKAVATDAEIYAVTENSAVDAAKAMLGEIPEFKSWQEVADFFRGKSAQYRKQGAGAVIQTAEWEVKASQVSRKLSLAKLVKSLGKMPDNLIVGLDFKGQVPIQSDVVSLKTFAEGIGAESIVCFSATAHSPKRLTAVETATVETAGNLLRKAEARTENVLVIPVAQDRRFLPLRDLTPDQAARLQQERQTAAVIQTGETLSAFVAVARQKRATADQESAAARQLTAELQQEYAPQFAALPGIAPLPAPGFKQMPLNLVKKATTATLIQVAKVACRKTTARFKTLISRWAKKAQGVFITPPVNTPSRYLKDFDAVGLPKTVSAAIFHIHLQDLAKKSTATGLDLQDLGILIAQRLRDGGSSSTDMIQILADGLAQIHDADADVYIPSELAKTIVATITDENAQLHPPIQAMQKTWADLTTLAVQNFKKREVKSLEKVVTPESSQVADDRTSMAVEQSDESKSSSEVLIEGTKAR